MSSNHAAWETGIWVSRGERDTSLYHTSSRSVRHWHLRPVMKEMLNYIVLEREESSVTVWVAIVLEREESSVTVWVARHSSEDADFPLYFWCPEVLRLWPKSFPELKLRPPSSVCVHCSWDKHLTKLLNWHLCFSKRLAPTMRILAKCLDMSVYIVPYTGLSGHTTL